MFRLPSQEEKRWSSRPGEKYEGVLSRTVGADLRTAKGRVRGGKMKMLSQTDDFASNELDDEVIAFAWYNGRYYANDTDQILKSDTNNANPDDEFIADALSGTPSTDSRGDFALFDEALYASEDDVINKLANTTWTTPITGLTSGTNTLLEPWEGRLYCTDDRDRVKSIDESDTLASNGTFTLDLDLNDNASVDYFDIKMLTAGVNNLWVGTDSDTGSENYMYQWNGVTEDEPAAIYRLVAGVLSGVVWRATNTPVIFDRRGRLLQFNGAGFDVLDELPINGILRDDAVHYNGMMESEEGEILINFKNETFTEPDYSIDAPSGIWAYHPEIGLYHKYSYTTQRTTESGSTGADDWGQLHFEKVGAIFPARERNANAGGTFFASIGYTETGGNSVEGIFTDDFENASQTYTQLITRWLEAEAVEDTFTSVAVKHSKLLTSDDYVELKYRLDDHMSADGNCTFTSTTSFTTTATSMADIKTRFDEGEGHEVTILTGTGAGKCYKVTALTEAAGTYTVTVDESFGVSSSTSRFCIENWNELVVQTNMDARHTKATIGKSGTKCQVKVNIMSTGPVDLEEILVNNKPTVFLA